MATLQIIQNSTGSLTFITSSGIELTMYGGDIVMETFNNYDSVKFHDIKGRWSSNEILIKDLTVAGGTDKASKVNVLKNTFNIGSGGGTAAGTSTSDASAANQVLGITALNSILAELKNDVFVSQLIWEDRSSTVAVFYREERIRSQDNGTITTVYTRLSDNVVVGSLPAGAIPVFGANDRVVESFRFRAVAAGTGYSIGDYLTLSQIIDTDASGAIIASFWYNITTSASISAPAPANIVDDSQQASAGIGAKTDSKATDSTSSWSLISLLKGIYALFADTRGTGTINAAILGANYSIAPNNGAGTASFVVTGLTSSGATLAIEASDDGGTTWNTVNGIAPQTGILFNTLTSDQQFRVNAGARTQIRLKVAIAGTGTINAASNYSVASSAVVLSSPLPQGSNSLGNVGLNAGNKYIGQVGQLPGSQDVFGANVSTSRQPQINIQFNAAFLQTLINLATSGGASASVNPALGYASFSTGTATTAQATGVSPAGVVYQSGSEIWAEFTALFTAPTSAASYQRIGLFNSTNGFFVGYNGINFSIASRVNSVDTFVNQASWNVDTLSGGANSLFTRNGTPEALNQTNFNIYRIRFGWLGIATVFYEAMSPDGNWVTVHKILYPNLGTAPSIATANLPITLDISKTSSDATNLVMGTACWAAGITGSIFPQSSGPAPRDSQAVIMTPAPQKLFRTTFSKTIASGVDADFWNLIAIGAGQTVAQTSGNLVIGAQTTANSETIIRSNQPFTGSFLLREQTILSQRIANNNFFVELVDIIGDGLAVTVNSATSITITFPNTFPVDATSFVGQSMYIGNLAGFTGVTAIPGRYAIASVSGQNVTFTVAGFATGAGNTGTCSVFGWNYHQILYSGALTATQVNYDTQRKGWNSGFTTAAINTTASPGHMGIMGSDDGNAFFADKLVASATTFNAAVRASRDINIAEEKTPLFLQIRSVNGSTAPASNTTWTIGTVSVENFSPQAVNISSVKVQGAGAAEPVNIVNVPGVIINSGTVTTVTTVTTVATVTTLANGQTAHSAAATGSPLRIGGRVVPTTIATVDLTLVAGDASDAGITTGQQLIIKEGGTSELDFNIPIGFASNTITVQPILGPSGTASVRNYVKSIRISSTALSVGGSFLIMDSALSISSIAITTGLATTSSAHDLRVGDTIFFFALAGGSGLTSGASGAFYYITAVPSTTTFNFSLTPGGANAVPGTSYTSGTMYRVFDQILLGTAAQNLPLFVYNQPLRGISNTQMNLWIPVSLGTGGIYLTINGYRGF